MRFIILSFMFVSLSSILSAQESYMLIGKGGGVAGTVTIYKITKNGKVQKGSGKVEIVYTESSKVGKSTAKKWFGKMDEMNLPPFSYPGNIYSFISYNKNGQEIKYTWGANDYEVPEQLQVLFNDALSKLSELEYEPK